jgi:predicted amidohydrolase
VPRRSLAAAQTVPVAGDIAANVAQHLHFVRAAVEAGADVIVFPELSLTGYELDRAAELAFDEHDPRLAPMVELASAHRVTLVAGAPVRIGALLHIGALIVLPGGGVEIYTKRHLGAFPSGVNPGGAVPPPEASVFQAGARDPLVRLGAHTAAVAICADTGRPSHPAAAAARGATTYLASVFVIPPDFAADTARLQCYAAQHRMAVVFANFGGPSGGLPSAGKSAIWSETGELLARMDGPGAGLVVATEEDDDDWRAETIMLDAV